MSLLSVLLTERPMSKQRPHSVLTAFNLLFSKRQADTAYLVATQFYDPPLSNVHIDDCSVIS